MAVFKTAALNRSATTPGVEGEKGRRVGVAGHGLVLSEAKDLLTHRYLGIDTRKLCYPGGAGTLIARNRDGMRAGIQYVGVEIQVLRPRHRFSLRMNVCPGELSGVTERREYAGIAREDEVRAVHHMDHSDAES